MYKMNSRLRRVSKKTIGNFISHIAPQCSFERSIFLLAHMRCGSTALSNVLCSRSDVSGYGESHVEYISRESIGGLILNQALRRSWSPSAKFTYDKILHSRHDCNVCGGFYRSRAIFIAREPAPTIKSIRRLFLFVDNGQYNTDEIAIQYYVERVNAILKHWERFPVDHRFGITYSQLINDPDAVLSQITKKFKLYPPLENRYLSGTASRSAGAGDPIDSGKYTKLVKRNNAERSSIVDDLDVSEELRNKAEDAYDTYVRTIEK